MTKKVTHTHATLVKQLASAREQIKHERAMKEYYRKQLIAHGIKGSAKAQPKVAR